MIRTENYARELLFIFFAQKKIIISVALIILAFSALVAFYWPPTYAAYGSILVTGKKLAMSPEAIEKAETRSYPVTKEDLFSEVEILTSFDVIEQTIKYLIERNLYKIENNSKHSYYKDILKKIKRNLKIEERDTKSSLYNEVYKVKKRIKTEVIPASNVIEITFYHDNPKTAVKILEALMTNYKLYRLQVYSPSAAEAFFSQQAEKFKEGLEKKEDELMDLVQETRISNPEKEIENNIIIKKDLEYQLNILKNDYIEKNSYVKHLEKVINSKGIQYFAFIENLPINRLGERLQEIVIERGRLLRIYNPRSEKVLSIDKQINEVYSSLKSEVTAFKDNLKEQLMITQSKIQSIENRLDVINNRNIELQRQIIDAQRIARETNLLNISYETFAKRREEAKINSTVYASNLSSYVRILSKPFPSKGAIFPQKMVVIPIGILIGFITGCSLGFLNEYFDHTFKKPNDVHNYADLPVIFSIPKWDKKRSFKTYYIVGFVAIIIFLGAVMLIRSGSAPSGWNLVNIKAAKQNEENQNYLSKENRDTVTAESELYLKHKISESVKPESQGNITDKAIVPNERGEVQINLSGDTALEDSSMAETGAEMDRSEAFSLIRKSLIFYNKKQNLWYFLVHSFKKYEIAVKEAERFKNAGWQTIVQSIQLKGYGKTHRVMVGPFNEKEDALQARSDGPVEIFENSRL